MPIHNIDPVWDKNSTILILGSFPSVKSRETVFFYGHPQNRFWKVISSIFYEAVPETITEKKEMLLRNHIAVWDVIHSCNIKGSSDNSIENVIPNDIEDILIHSKIKKIYCNGTKSFELYKKYILPKVLKEAILLPSTSPANAAWSLDKLTNAWKIIKE